jgi:hypothetical protein
MRRTIATTAGIAALLATAAPAQAQSAAGQRLTKASAENRLEAAVARRGGQSVNATCRRPKRGKAVCGATFTKADGRQCTDSRVTVVRKRRSLKVKGLNPACSAPQPVEPAPGPATELPPGAAETEPPTGVPETGDAQLELPFDLSDLLPAGPPPSASAAGATARAASPLVRNGSFMGCVWQQWSGWWLYYCFWDYSSAPQGAHLIGWQRSYYYEVWYWTGSQIAFWFAGNHDA